MTDQPQTSPRPALPADVGPSADETPAPAPAGDTLTGPGAEPTGRTASDVQTAPARTDDTAQAGSDASDTSPATTVTVTPRSAARDTGAGADRDGRAGFVALVGRPNVGKSTLLNALLGQKVAIMSDRPQTTRSVIRGVHTRPDGQLVFLDTPGLHKPRTLLGRRLNDLVHGTLAEVDLVCFLVDAAAGIGPGDRFLAAQLAEVHTPVVAVANKLDAATQPQAVQALDGLARLGEWAEIVPVSALTGDQVDVLADVLVGHLPVGPPLFSDGDVTDQPEALIIAEVIREKALALVRDELPHSIAVVVDDIIPDEPEEPPAEPPRTGRRPRHRHRRQQQQGGPPTPEFTPSTIAVPAGRMSVPDNAERPAYLTVHASLYVERDSQKAIVIGRGGSVLREIGTQARTELQALLGTRIHLDLLVKVAKEWQGNPKLLSRLGF